ncbi:MAG TPA: hypothetical protein VJM08_05100, partial [Anaerolineales bacterium]|nr:hypothetical protein [Anaerolineales bacterium]
MHNLAQHYLRMWLSMLLVLVFVFDGTDVRVAHAKMPDVTGVGHNQNATLYCSPNTAGNPDMTCPTIIILSPVGATFPLGLNVRANFTSQDEAGGSGLAFYGVVSRPIVANGGLIDTATSGLKFIRIEAGDRAGNIALLTYRYFVIAGPPGRLVGTVVGWGGSPVDREATLPLGVRNVSTIAASHGYSVILTSDGKVKA